MTPADSLKLENQLCFALYAAANAITRAYRGALNDFGLTYPQYLVIIALFETKSMTSGELARALRLDAGTLTPMLKRLAASGLIRRTRRVGDERVIDNELTPAGLALWDGLLRAHNQVRCRTQLTDDEFDNLRLRLHCLIDHLSSPMPDEIQGVSDLAIPA